MSKVPNPERRDDRIADNTDYRDGYAQGYLDAVRTAAQLSDQNLELVLAAWGAER